MPAQDEIQEQHAAAALAVAAVLAVPAAADGTAALEPHAVEVQGAAAERDEIAAQAGSAVQVRHSSENRAANSLGLRFQGAVVACIAVLIGAAANCHARAVNCLLHSGYPVQVVACQARSSCHDPDCPDHSGGSHVAVEPDRASGNQGADRPPCDPDGHCCF